MGVVKTMEGMCSICFSCIRNCPVKAIKVEKGQATVIPELCIYCGHCVEVCARGAKQVRDSLETLEGVLVEGRPVVACLAPSYLAEYADYAPGQVAAALRVVGFNRVYEVAYGAQIVAQAYSALLSKPEQKGLISTACPSIVFLVEKYFPTLLPRLVPIVSPMVALGRVLKEETKGQEPYVVFIGPCAAKKAEMQDENLQGGVDLVLTFPELDHFFKKKGITLDGLQPIALDSPPVHAARVFPLPGGLLKTAALNADILENRIVTVEGRQNSLDFLRNAAEGDLRFDFADILFCHGCVSGPLFTKKMDYFTRMDLLKRQAVDHKDRFHCCGEDLETINLPPELLSRRFSDKSLPEKIPTEEQINEVLYSLEKYSAEDELNCGACGYETCRSKATAVVRGLAEKDMCLPYLIRKLEKSNRFLKNQLEEDSGVVGRFIGNSRAMQQVYQMIRKVAGSDTTVLITGESGTGKELAAQAIHSLSPRAGSNYVSINCAALPEPLLESELFGHVKGSFTGAVGDKKGLFEEAHNGTILLDEIGDVSLTLQVKLLRVLQEGELLRIGETKPRKVNVRVIAATNKDLQELIEKGTFRADLYYRLNVVSIHMPSLREKREDIPLLASVFLKKFSEKLAKPMDRIGGEAMAALLRARWKGNVRELENAIEHALLMCEGSEIILEDLPADIHSQKSDPVQDGLGEEFSLKAHLEEYQKSLIIKALEESGWVQARAAKKLGLNRSTLHEICKRYDL